MVRRAYLVVVALGFSLAVLGCSSQSEGRLESDVVSADLTPRNIRADTPVVAAPEAFRPVVGDALFDQFSTNRNDLRIMSQLALLDLPDDELSPNALAGFAAMAMADADEQDADEENSDDEDSGDNSEDEDSSEESDDSNNESDDSNNSDNSSGSNNTTTTARQTTTTTKPTTTTTRPTTTQPPTTQSSSGNGEFKTLPPGSQLPSGSECASRVRSASEVRTRTNPSFNNTRGNGSHDLFPRVDGNFTGTTDEIIQWAACKWGIDVNIVRAQALVESWWDTSRGGDPTSNQSLCHPEKRSDDSECDQSVGLLQIKFKSHPEAYENSNAIRSTAYNADYAYAYWRECYEGRLTWLNDVDRGRQYAAGDADGCLGVWFAGRWYNSGAQDYIDRMKREVRDRRWEGSSFLGYDEWLAKQGR